jgi:hypothetical protein
MCKGEASTLSSFVGADGGTRTHKIWLLRPTRIPIPSHPRNSIYTETHYLVLTSSVGLSPATVVMCFSIVEH